MEDGAPVPETTGAVRAQSPLHFPTQTVKASTLLPDLDKYTGTPLEYGRMEPTASDPGVAAAVRNDRRHSEPGR
jgi:amidase